MIAQELRLSARRLLKAPGFAAVAILTLALGIGANTAIFSIVDQLILRPLPYADSERLVQLWEDYKGDGASQNNVSGGVARSWQEQSTLLEGMAATNGISANLASAALPMRLRGLQVSTSYLHLLRMSPILGRDFLAEEGQNGRSDVVILTDAAWRKYFGGRTDIVGRTIPLSKKPTTVIGVLAPSARLTAEADFLKPFAYDTPGWSPAFTGHNLLVIGRLKPSATLSAFKQEMAAITDRIRVNYPDFKKKWGVTVVPLHDQVTGSVRPQLFLLFGATACVLLIACSNVAGLLLARAVGREKEMAVRIALGASRGSVMRQVLVENLLLSLIGGAAGLLLAEWGVKVFEAWRPPDFVSGIPVALEGRAVAFALALSLIAGLAAGLAPAWRLARARFDQLKSGSRDSEPGVRSGVRGALIVGQIALSLILLIGAGLLLKSLVRLQSVPLGFEPRGILAADLTLDSDAFRDVAARVGYLERITERVQAIPGVESAGVASYLPLQGDDTEYASAVGTKVPDVVASINFVSEGYLAAMGVHLARGRQFTAQDEAPNAAPVMIVNRDISSKFFGNADPLGRYVSLWGHSYEVVGVTDDVLVRGVEVGARPEIYMPENAANGFERSLVVRTRLDPLALASEVRAAIAAAAPSQPVSNLRTYERVLEKQGFTRHLMLTLIAAFAATALILATIGLYGIIAFSVNSRTRELGIRAALGASPPSLFVLIISAALRLTAIGIVLGLVGGLFLTRFISAFLFDTRPTDPATLAIVTLLLVTISILACLAPARRAMKVDPMEALRAE